VQPVPHRPERRTHDVLPSVHRHQALIQARTERPVTLHRVAGRSAVPVVSIFDRSRIARRRSHAGRSQATTPVSRIPPRAPGVRAINWRHDDAVDSALAVLATLAGCGSSASTASQPPTAASVARQLGCTGIEPVSPATLYAYDEADATCHGRAADIATFRTNKLRDQWVAVASQFGGIASEGDRYAVADG